MANSIFVAINDTLHDLFEDVGGVLFGQVVSVRDVVEQLSALAELLHQIYSAVVFVDFVQLDDVRVVEVFERSDFVDDALVVDDFFERNFFDGSKGAGFFFESSKYCPESSFTNRRRFNVIVFKNISVSM